MRELIDRYATMDAIPAPTDADEAEYYGKICDAIKTMPTIEPEVRYGRWETINPLYSNVYCSECGAAADKYLAKRYKGCPFCLCVIDSTDNNVSGRGGANNVL